MEINHIDNKDNDIFKRQYKNQNLTKLPEFKEWYNEKKKYVE
jgi:hypothetical protein